MGELDGRPNIDLSYIVHSIAWIIGASVALAPTVYSAIREPFKLPKVIKKVPAAALFVIVSPVKTTLVEVVGVQIERVVEASNSVYLVCGVNPFSR